MRKKNSIDVCLTPNLIDLFDVQNKVVVVIDVFRATSAICTALYSGVQEVIPVSTLDEAKTYLNKDNYLVAAERNGTIVPGFDLGNSPLDYLDKEKLKNYSLVITTTNGTTAIERSKNAKALILASFLNIQSVVQFLVEHKQDVLIICSGWKGRVCIEDMVLAGMITNLLLKYSFFINQDSSSVVLNLYKLCKDDMYNFIMHSSYINRTNMHSNDVKEKLYHDIKYCLKINIINIVPIFNKRSFFI
mgnify:CR=1 FL=1